MKTLALLAALVIMSGCQSLTENTHAIASPTSLAKQQLNTVNSLLSIRAVDQVSPTQWRFTVKYKGNRPIGELDFVGELYNEKQLLTKVSAKPRGRFKPDSNYYIITKAQSTIPMGTRVTSFELETRQVQVY